jgi:hypothetical protein
MANAAKNRSADDLLMTIAGLPSLADRMENLRGCWIIDAPLEVIVLQRGERLSSITYREFRGEDVLLHFHTLGFSPVQLAYLFVLYEIAGVITNLSAGWMAARFGLTSTLYSGLSLQVVALLALTQLDPAWSIRASVVFVMLVQGLSGVAKDLAKMSSKSAVTILAPTTDGGAFPLGGYVSSAGQSELSLFQRQ